MQTAGGRSTQQLASTGAAAAARESMAVSYERSGAELKAQAKEERKRREEDAVLMTKAQREALKLKRAGGAPSRQRGGALRLRVRRPDGTVFEAQFRGEEESLVDVYAWAAEVLGVDTFLLVTPPPGRTKLPRDDTTPLTKHKWCDAAGTMLIVSLTA